MTVPSFLTRGRLHLAALAAGLFFGGAAAETRTTPVDVVHPGELFPSATFDNLNAASGGPAKIDLGQVLGKKPILLFYWIPGHPRAESMFAQLEQLAGDLGTDRITLYGVAVQRPGLDADAIRERIKTIGVRAPVLDDEGFSIGRRLSVNSVPHVSIIDREGRLRLTNGASLVQVVGYKTDLALAIRKVGETGQLMTYGVLDRYYPVKELEGQRCPDFSAPLLTTSVEQKWKDLLSGDKVNVLIFWSVDCPHCRKSLPEINAWVQQHPNDVNVVTAANVDTDAAKTKTREFCESNHLLFPTLVDQDARIGQMFQVTTTPTILIIGPDGVIDSAIVSGEMDFGRTIEEKKRKLLGPPGSRG